MFKHQPLFKIVLLFLCLGFSNLVAAHAVVTDSSLKIEPIPHNQETQVRLNFNSNIELGLSQFFLVREGDRQTPLEVTMGNKPGRVLIQIPALKTGEYAIRFKVFAADGHLTEDILHFFVTQ